VNSIQVQTSSTPTTVAFDLLSPSLCLENLYQFKLLTMSELTFTKSFLSTLDSRPIKLRADHVFDPEQIGLRVPVSLDAKFPGLTH
jgi:hypothetical protein